MPITRPEETGPPENFYDVKEARKYTSSSRIISVQADIADRCIELLNLEPGKKKFVLDVGCGSGLSGAALERAGHEWVGCDVSRDMLRIASEREAAAAGGGDDDDDVGVGFDGMDDDDDDEEESGSDDDEEEESSEDEDGAGAGPRRTHVGSAELVQHDMGLGLPFRDGTFDGAISVSALQWLCYDNDSRQSATKRLGRFFASLYRCLKSGSRAALQFYPESDAQATLIASAAARAGFAGGVVARRRGAARGGVVVAGGGERAPKRRKTGKKPAKDRAWVLRKKEYQRARAAASDDPEILKRQNQLLVARLCGDSTPPMLTGTSATASAFVPQTIVAPETNELDEVDAQNELLADLELLEAMEIASRCADLVVDDAPAPLKSVANVAAVRALRRAASGQGAALSDARSAAAAEARAKGGGKKKAGAKGRAQGGPRAQKVGKSQNDKCLP
ncbi:hypothetical protein JL720_129 [Aureococcus anophagefferens]|nr:hypothetical protein JL720_129 [Aureococcus anophagefferens]